VESELKKLLIIGAGPYGLSLALAAKGSSVDYALVGRPLSLWRTLPRGMPLRTKMTARFDPLGTGSFGTFLQQRGVAEQGSTPISRELFADYVEWALQQEPVQTINGEVAGLSEENGIFSARLLDGTVVRAKQVAVATGALPHVYIPETLKEFSVPVEHSLQVSGYAEYAGARVCVVGGRQSAFESAVLAAEAGAQQVYVVYPHESPVFADSHWSWLADEIARVRDGVLFSALPKEERQQIVDRFHHEGRAKLEPSLAERAQHSAIVLVPDIAAEDFLRSGVIVDRIISATGFRPRLRHVDFIAPQLHNRIELEEGYPALSAAFESTAPGLFFTGMLAAGSFGPLLEYMHGSAVAAQRIIGAIQARPE